MLTDNDFKDFIISVQVESDNNGGYKFAPVNAENCHQKILAADPWVNNFIVAPGQNHQKTVDNLTITITEVPNFGELLKFIRRRGIAGEKFREEAKTQFEAHFEGGKYPEPVLTALRTKLPIMGSAPWQQILLDAQRDNQRRHSVFEYLMKPPLPQRQPIRLVLFGDPGIGKSDLLRYVASECARNFAYVPFYIDLSACKDKDKDINKYIEIQAKKIDNNADVDSLLDRGDFLLLFDSLDSVGWNAPLFKSIELFCKRKNKCQIIFSCDSQKGNEYLGLTGNYQLSIINGLPLHVRQQIISDLEEGQAALFNFLKRDVGIARLFANPAFFKSLKESIQKCNNPETLVKKWDQLTALFEQALDGHEPECTSDALKSDLIALANEKLKRVFKDITCLKLPNKKNDKVRAVLIGNKILIRTSGGSGYRFSTPSFLAYFATKSLLEPKHKKALDTFLNSPGEDLALEITVPDNKTGNPEDTFGQNTIPESGHRKALENFLDQLSRLADDASSREIFSFLYVNGKIKEDLIISLLDPEKDDVFLHRSTLAIKCLQQDDSILGHLKDKFEVAAKKLIALWNTSDQDFQIEADYLSEAIINLKSLKPGLVERGFESNLIDLSEWYGEYIGEVGLSKIQTKETLETITSSTEDILKLQESLKKIYVFDLSLDPNQQSSILNFLSNTDLELESLDVLLKTKLDDEVKKEAIKRLEKQLKYPDSDNIRQKTESRIREEFEKVCKVITRLGFEQAGAEDIISNLFTFDNADSIVNRSWLGIELAQYYNLMEFQPECRETILSGLGELHKNKNYRAFIKGAATELFKNTIDTKDNPKDNQRPGPYNNAYKVRQELALYIWSDLSEKSQEVLPPEFNLRLTQSSVVVENLLIELSTRHNYNIGKDLIERIKLVLLGAPEIDEISRKLLLVYTYGDSMVGERILQIIREGLGDSAKGKIKKKLQKQLNKPFGDDEREVTAKYLELYTVINDTKKQEDLKDTIEKMLALINDGKVSDEVLRKVKNITLLLEKNANLQPAQMEELVNKIVNIESTEKVINSFTHQLDKSGFRFRIYQENGTNKISAKYNDFKKITLNA